MKALRHHCPIPLARQGNKLMGYQVVCRFQQLLARSLAAGFVRLWQFQRQQDCQPVLQCVVVRGFTYWEHPREARHGAQCRRVGSRANQDERKRTPGGHHVERPADPFYRLPQSPRRLRNRIAHQDEVR